MEKNIHQKSKEIKFEKCDSLDTLLTSDFKLNLDENAKKDKRPKSHPA